MRRVFVDLPQPAIDALVRLAEREFRAPKDQAALMLVEALNRAGVLAPDAAAGPSGKPD